MSHRRLALVLLVLAAGGIARLVVAPAGSAAAPVPAAAAPFTLPPGFVAEKVAGPPLVEHPIMAGFDEKGRLFVADNAGKNLPAAELLKQLPNCIRVLEDTDGDGRFDKSTVFADKMAFPMGALWHRGALYTLAAPSLWKLEDTDGDGIADRRTELITKFGFTGNAADVHGPFLGPDGRLYFTQGRHGHEVKLPDGTILKGKAARIFRCKPDGSEFERVCGGGMDDPVEMAFTEEGEPFATVDILIGSPARHDAIIYCIDGGAWPYYEPVMGEFKRTGDLLPPVTDRGWVAPSGLTTYRSAVFGEEYQGNLFSTEFNTHKVVRHVLTRDGAHFKSRDEDFLVSTDPDFHPTCVREDADGSLLVLDTGGWFRIGCPTSQIAKPEVKGAIWRIRKKGAPRVEDPRGLKLKWDGAAVRELMDRLDDPRWAVRDRAVEELGRQGHAAVGSLVPIVGNGKTAAQRRNAVWALTRMEGPEARVAVQMALRDEAASVRIAAARSAGLHRDRNALGALRRLVRSGPPEVRREAATALGRLRQRGAAPALLEALADAKGDRFLEHALIYALIEINDRAATLPGLQASDPAVRRGALIALDQMDAGGLTRQDVEPLLVSRDLALQRTLWAVLARRPDWAGALVDWLREALMGMEAAQDSERREMLREVLVQFGKNAAVQGLVAEAVKDAKVPAAGRLLLLEVMAVAAVDKVPPAWVDALRSVLGSPDERMVRQAVAVVRGRSVEGCDAALGAVAADAKRPAGVRVQALAAVAPRLKGMTDDQFAFLRGRLAAEQPLERLAAAEALGRAPLSDAQLDAVAQLLPEAGALELGPLVSAFERSKNPAVGRNLIAALTRCKSLPGLTPDRLRAALANYPDDVKRSAEPVFKVIAPGLEEQKARLARLEPWIGKGQIERGKVLFYGQKAVCYACHTAQGRGGTIGPDLTKIGAIRTGRDLLEAIVAPSASIVRGFEPYTVTTRQGKTLNGLVRRETADALYLVTAERTEVRVARADVEAVEPSGVSVMPQGIDGQLTPQEIADLLAFLQSLK